jgi:hypothetical protein
MAVLFPDDLAKSAADWSTPPPDPVIEAYKKDVDVTLLVENLKLTVEQRIQKLVSVQRFILELRRAGQLTSAD